MTGEMDTAELARLLNQVHAQVITALWLSGGMLCAFGGWVSIAFGFRRVALAFGFAYSFTLFFVHNGYAGLLAPVGCAVTLTAIAWPKAARGPKPSR